jgi:hypothetical protein
MGGSRLRTLLWVGLLIAAPLLSLMGWKLRLEPMPSPEFKLLPYPVMGEGNVELITPGYVFTAPLAAYRDELFAFLMFDYLRHSTALGNLQLLLAFDEKDPATPYTLMVRGRSDLRASIADYAALRFPVSAPAHDWKLTPAERVKTLEQQTQIFISAYNLPVRRKMEDLPRKALESYVRRFIRFKSATDPRIRRSIEPVPEPLTSGDAQSLAGDILTIADFYSLPLEFFLGIGAMENNYMNVRGDLKHSIWKRRPAPDDVVLERRGGRVRILNDSAGVWQITRETLRYAHSLIQKDQRDYLSLPEHLQPPPKLRMDEVDPQVLTTYAGILLRDLLDRFDGDVMLAVSAYNGGPARPNLRYGEGVHRAAAHARRVLEQAAALNEESVVNKSWIR